MRIMITLMNTRHWVYHFICKGKEGESEREEGSQRVDRTLYVQERGGMAENLGRMTAKREAKLLETGRKVDRNSQSRERRNHLSGDSIVAGPRRIHLQNSPPRNCGRRMGWLETPRKLRSRPGGTLACALASKAPKGRLSSFLRAACVRI